MFYRNSATRVYIYTINHAPPWYNYNMKYFNYTVRYIDDLLTFNNAKFETEKTNIYPSELTLKRITESATLLSYLDIINHDRFSTTLYDSFSFDIVNFPDMNSNIPSKPAYGVYISQLIRIGRRFFCFCIETL